MEYMDFETYRAEVKRKFMFDWGHLEDDEIERFLDSKKEKIECDYRGYIEYLKAESAGTVDMYTPSGNSPSAVGFCLAMMY